MIDKLDSYGISYNNEITDRSILEERHNIDIVNSVIKDLDVPQYGFIVEYGSWRGGVVDALTGLYGLNRVLGFDISNFTNHSQVHKLDVRHLSGNANYKMPIALAWNDLSEWYGSPMGKQAAFDHALNNLVNGGIYIEHKKCPDYIAKHPNLTLVLETQYLLMFKYTT